MERLTFDGNFCDIVQCENTPNGSYCESDGSCFLRKVWERLKAYETTGLTPEACAEAREAGKVLSSCDISFRRLAELLTADRAGRLVVLPFTSGRTLLSKENINSPRLMKDVELAIRYCSSCGIVFHMDYNVFCDLVKHGRITAVSEEAEKALEALKDGN